MLNVLKMDLFRLVRSKSLYVTILISVIMAAFVCWASNVSTGSASTNSDGAITVESYGVSDTVDSYIGQIFKGNFVILFVVIFIVIFCNTERKNGYIKNVASIVSDKYKTVVSKMVILTLYVLAIYAALTATILIACYGFFGITQVDSVCTIVKFIGTGILMNISIGALVIMFFTVVEKSMVVMATSIVYVLMGQTIFMLVRLFTDKVLKLDSFDAYKYTNLGNMEFVEMNADSSTYVRALVVAGVIFVISYVVAALAIKKKDIN